MKNRKLFAKRRGTVVVLVASMLVIFLLMAAFSIDVAYMQLVRTELRVATDAAAKAGTESLSRDQSGESAVQAAIDTAALNRVAGEGLTLTTDDVEIGRSSLNSSGVWEFTAGAEPYNSVRVAAKRNDSNAAGKVSLFLGSIFGVRDFAPEQTAIASQLDQDICLVVDRSHSMCWDLSNNEWSYPSGEPWYKEYCSPPESGSRWGAMQNAIDAFFAAINETDPIEYASLVTFASDYTYCGRTVTDADQDVLLSSNYAPIPARLEELGNLAMPGGTNIFAGITEGEAILTGPTSRQYSQKTMIVLTDGRWTHGDSPVDAAAAAAAQGIVVHTITFSAQADQTLMQQVAAAGNGNHYHAPNAEALEDIYREIAFTLPVVLTK